MDHREQLPIGAELVGDYRIDGVLGQGGFGITYAATDLALGKTVAIKEYFPTEFATRDATLTIRPKSERHGEMYEWGRKGFLDEAQTLAKFRHPAIVRVQRFFEALNTGYMVLEFEEGERLGHWLGNLGRPATQAELDGIVSPLLDALAEMHAANFIHRDIAPDNIIIRPDGSPVLLDFGAARQAIAAETKTLTGIVKAGYSPPEQYLSEPGRQGPWTDIYAMGATLYRAVTGAAPPEVPARQIDATYVPVAAASHGDYRPSFLAAIDWALKLKMAQRPQSVSAFQEALRGGQVGSETVAKREAVSGNQHALETAPTHAAPKPPHRNRGVSWKWAAAALIAIVGGTGGYFAYDHLQAERQRVQDLADAQAARVARLAREAEEDKRKAEAKRKRAEDEKRRKADVLRRADERAWQELIGVDTLEAYKAYLKKFPNGIHKDAALAKIAALEAEDKRKAEADSKRRAGDIADCIQRSDVGRRIRGCTRWLKEDQLSRAERVGAYNYRGLAYYKKGQHDRAIADYDKSIQLKPEAWAYNARGVAYYKKGDRRKAIADYRKALQIDPYFGSAERNLKAIGVRP